MWIVKIPKHYRTNGEVRKFIGPFPSSNEAEIWVKNTFIDDELYMFTYHKVFVP